MLDYAVVTALTVALLAPLMLFWGRVAAAVKCGVCGQRQRLFFFRKTYSCKRCKKTLPRRLAIRTGRR